MPTLIGVQYPTSAAARDCETGEVSLAFCRQCGFIWNTLFDPALLAYDLAYDNSLHFSAVFQRYSQQVVEELAASCNLRGKRIADIGCGKGDFLAMLCEHGDNFGFGFDPAFDGARVETSAADRIQWFTENYTEQHAGLQADLITSRYVFEHVPQPLPFLRMIRRSIQDPERTTVYFEVPNVKLILAQHSVWDIIYEHCSYFGPESLPRAFELAGFKVLRSTERYAAQFVSVEAQVRQNHHAMEERWGDLEALSREVDTFAGAMARKLAEWGERLAQWEARRTRVVAWGAGAKAVSFLNMLEGAAAISEVVDVNPHKQGRHLAGTGHRIVAPRDLRVSPPDVVVLMNPIYRNEIVRQLADMDLHPEVVNA